jgi:hypothetical protein
MLCPSNQELQQQLRDSFEIGSVAFKPEALASNKIDPVRQGLRLCPI